MFRSWKDSHALEVAKQLSSPRGSNRVNPYMVASRLCMEFSWSGGDWEQLVLLLKYNNYRLLGSDVYGTKFY